MKQVLVGKIESSFLSCERDLQEIIELLFVKNKPYSDILKRLLIITNKDCLTNNKDEYRKAIDEYTIKKLIEDGFIKNKPKITVEEDRKTYIIITFTNFTPNLDNPAFRDCIINFDIICNQANWELDGFSNRPIKIMGYIDGILNGSRLSGIGTLQFAGSDIIVLNENLMGYTLSYNAIHNNLSSKGDDRSLKIYPKPINLE